MPGQAPVFGQLACLSHCCFVHLVVHAACLAFAFLTGTVPLAITEAAAKAIASMLKTIFFMFLLNVK